ncbi:MAG: P-loop NTPase [Nitrospirae bacterium]|nr:P-loop NTPase [Nitrospirota bacterium]MBI3352535.1 P-loop NTPase [Nitrospirota bacterium]
MEQTKSLKSILSKLQYPDDAQVMKQLIDQSLTVKTRMGRIKRKIVVLSGKGGVGKSMTTVNLAVAFARMGLKVGVLDVDLNGPCVPKMLGMKGDTFILTPEGALPPAGPYGIKVASMDFFLKKDSPVQWKGSMDLSPVWLGMVEMNVIREFLGDIIWGELDLLLADLPPGAAADKPPAMAKYIPELDGAVVVTTPSEVTGDVVRKSIVYTRDVGIKVIGLIENMSGFLCPECQTESELFDGSSDQLCEELDVPLLGKIPFSRKMSYACDHGMPLSDESEYTVKKFKQIAQEIVDRLRIKFKKGE